MQSSQCFVCCKSISSSLATSSYGNSSISGCSSVRDLTNVLFVVSNVFKMSPDRVENLVINFIAGRTKAEVEAGVVEKLICDRCGESMSKIVGIIEALLETSQDIDDVKKKLLHGQTRRRKFKVECDEAESDVAPSDDGPKAKVVPSDPGLDGEDVDMEDTYSPGDEPESCPSGDEDPASTQSPPPTVSGRKIRKSDGGRRKYSLKRKTMTCPFCNAFTESNRKVLRLCKHLQKCSQSNSNVDSSLVTLTCSSCKVFQSSDFVLFCEHFGVCAGPDDEATRQVIPIQNRLISCDCCTVPNCFMFDDYLQHYLYHQKYPMKCIHPMKDGSICTNRWDCRTSYCRHWRKMHRDQPNRLPRPKSYVVETTLPSIPFFCHLCNSRFQSLHLRNEHLDSCHAIPRNPPNLQTCPHCTFTSLIPEDVSIHLVTEHPLLVNHKQGQRRAHSCDLCDHHLPSELALRRHKRLVHLIQPPKMPKQPRKFRHGCADCGQAYNEANQLVSHRIRAHNATDLGPDPNECSICKKQFTAQSSLKLHMAHYHGGNKKQPDKSCHHCGKMLSSDKALTGHLFKFHGEGSVKEFKCPREGCNKVYLSINSLKSHEAVFHLKTPLFNCEICGKGYFCKQRFNRHLLFHVHPNFRPFSCDMCPSKTYRTPYELGLHWKSGHSQQDRAELEQAGVKEEQLKEFLRVVKEAGLEWNTRTPISID